MSAVRTISAKDLHALDLQQMLIVDVRTPMEFAEKRLARPTAFAPVAELNPQDLALRSASLQDTPILTLCASDRRADHRRQIVEAGTDVRVIEGSLAAQEAGHHHRPRSSQPKPPRLWTVRCAWRPARSLCSSSCWASLSTASFLGRVVCGRRAGLLRSDQLVRLTQPYCSCAPPGTKKPPAHRALAPSAAAKAPAPAASNRSTPRPKEFTMSAPLVRGFFDPITATWTYVVWSAEDSQHRCAVIDSVLDYDLPSCRTATTSADAVIAFVRAQGLTVEWILETHIHADHLTAASYIKAQLGGKIAISRHILDIIATWVPIFQTMDDTPADGSQLDHLFANDEEFSLAGMPARDHPPPGHTPADTTYIVGDAAFVGDTIFLPPMGSGRCDFPGGSAEDSYESSASFLLAGQLPHLYVGHDYPPDGARPPVHGHCGRTESPQRAPAHGHRQKTAFCLPPPGRRYRQAVPPLIFAVYPGQYAHRPVGGRQRHPVRQTAREQSVEKNFFARPAPSCFAALVARAGWIKVTRPRFPCQGNGSQKLSHQDAFWAAKTVCAASTNPKKYDNILILK